MPIHPDMRRCIYYRLNGQRCGSPALSGKARCWHHERILERRQRMKAPFVKNRSDLQQAIGEVIEGLVMRRIHRGDATAILYGLQLIQNNLNAAVIAQRNGEGEGSIIRGLLNEVEAVEELEDDAEIYKEKADFEEHQRMKALAEENRKKSAQSVLAPAQPKSEKG